ncbi:hypothetical protein I309_03257 [Cryptococcus deuterogattii LA55]|nr:hypothetical protein I309_03257 [Cryptococcus deuterogattii LA55]KIR90568.1 hypothetical protein I304_05710 [Cryptococcus deuterogattii CBS 10090]
MAPSKSPESSDPVESSGQALERYIVEQLSSLSLSAPQDDIEMMARFVEEEGLERDEKTEGVKGMLEGVIEGGVLPEEGLDEVLSQIIDEQARLHQLKLDRAAAEEEAARSPSPESSKVDDILATLTPEELAAARRQALLRQYAYVDSPDDAPANSPFGGEGRPEGAPPKGGKAAENEEKRKAEERRRLIEEALRKDSRKKKHRKNDEVDLLAPNLNKEKATYVMAMQREAQKKASQEKKDRDRAALEKQRADQAKAKADKQKRAAKQERRA